MRSQKRETRNLVVNMIEFKEKNDLEMLCMEYAVKDVYGSEEYGKDIRALIDVGGHLVGIETRGNNIQRQRLDTRRV